MILTITAMELIREQTDLVVGDNENQHQSALINMVDFASSDNGNDVFILTGPAGTGKTSLILEFVELLKNNTLDFCLLAPTGQAAKVLSKRTSHAARTLHSFVYVINEREDDEYTRYEFVPRMNALSKPCIFIVDEASMISDLPANNELFVSKNSLLHDFFEYYKNSPHGSKVVFVGDPFQLPPVNETESGALSIEYLEQNYGLKATGFNLTKVLRQQKGSYILYNASILRNLIEQKMYHAPKLQFKQMYRADIAINQFCKEFNFDETEHAVFLGWKNLTVDKLNKAIRNQIFKYPNEALCESEQIIVGRSYYSKLYLPAGEIGKVVAFNPASVERVADIYFAEATFQFELPDGEKIKLTLTFDLDYLLDGQSDEDPVKRKNLWADRMRKNKFFRETGNPADDPYLSAIKIKYGYAITAHKAQGGEWKKVFLYPEFPKDENRLKWIYTAVTRASDELYSF
jgi:exodeoxyribonuclease V